MPLVNASLGQQVDAWLDRLDDEGFQVGVRERLVVQTLLAHLSADGKLTEFQSSHEVLNIVGPLVCTKPEQQRQYALLLEEFLAKPRRTTTDWRTVQGPDIPIKPWKFQWWQILLLLFVLATASVAITWQLGLWEKPAPPPSPSQPVDKQVAPRSTEPAARIEKPIYVPVSSLPIPTPTQQVVAGWIGPIRYALLTLGALSGLALVWLAWARWRRQLYLQATRTDEEVTERFLQDPHPVVLQPSTAIVRGASRQLRQRYAGECETIDLPSTIKATIAAGGAFAPRYRALSQTPEYLILIDQRHPTDHHTVYSQTLVNGLKDAGVAVQVYYFEGSPQTGCWQVRQTPQGQDRIKATSVSELAARFAGYRLLVFGDAQALVEEADGEPRAWANHLRLFPQRAWLTPMPMASWGPLEQMVDEQGFLLLPIQQESLTTMASWFSSGHLGLEVADDWPLSYPTMLRGQGVAWVARQSAVPASDQEELLFQLRNYLGDTRFQWLCACALFPAVSPAITLALGLELVGEDMRELALGMASIGALPWFRHAFMPAWLRQALINCLNQTNEARFREVIEMRLSDAVEDRIGASLLSVAEKKRLLTAWFRRRSGLARDVVLVDFLYRGPLTKLAQRLPEALRKRLFRGGLSAYGLTRGVLRLLPLGLLIGLLGVPGMGDRLFTVPASTLQLIGILRGHDAVVLDAVFGPDGRMVVTASMDKTVRLWDVASLKELSLLQHENLIGHAQFSSDGKTVVTASGLFLSELSENSERKNKTARLWDVASGKELLVLRGHEGSVMSAQFAPDGQTVVTASSDKTARLWDVASGKELLVLRGHEGSVTSAQFAPDGQTVVTASSDETARLWDVASGKELLVLRGHEGSVISAQFAPDGQTVVTASSDKTARLWDVASGKELLVLRGHEGWMGRESWIKSAQFAPDGKTVVTWHTGILGSDATARVWGVANGRELYRLGEFGIGVVSVQFSPSGKTMVIADVDGTARLWGQPLAPTLDLLSCSTDQGVTNDLQSLTDRVADAVNDKVLPELSPVAYHLSAWQRPDGLKQIPYGTVLYGEDNLATAEALAKWLGSQPNTAKQTGPNTWRVEQSASLGNQRFAVNTCAASTGGTTSDTEQMPSNEPKVSDSAHAISLPVKVKPLAGLRVAVFGCTVAEREARNIIKSILPAIERLGGKPNVQMINEKQRSRFAPSDTGLNIRVTQKVPQEVLGAKALRSQPEFVMSGNWQQIFTRQQSQNYVSIFVCPVKFPARTSTPPSTAADSYPTTAPAPTIPDTASVPDPSPKPNIEQKSTDLTPTSPPSPSSSPPSNSPPNAPVQQGSFGTEQSAKPQGSSSNAVQGDATALYQKRILWVDDQPENNRQEIASLTKLRIEIVTASSTREALARIESDRQPFDLVLSDWQRPELHLDTTSAGIHLLRQLRKQKLNIPVVFYHRTTDEKERAARHEQALHEGAFGEAVTPTELLGLVTRALAMKRDQS